MIPAGKRTINMSLETYAKLRGLRDAVVMEALSKGIYLNSTFEEILQYFMLNVEKLPVNFFDKEMKEDEQHD